MGSLGGSATVGNFRVASGRAGLFFPQQFLPARDRRRRKAIRLSCPWDRDLVLDWNNGQGIPAPVGIRLAGGFNSSQFIAHS